ncbi:outer membrane receptor for transport of vitamin B [Bacteroidetes oral taxon 274 str. F0058]|nr:outer membrane receptor for transport of vitamin B [Bacteroidetes oral taxon 274 str. F0058]
MFTASFCPLLTAQNEKDSIESTPLTEVVATAKEQKEIISAQKLSGQELDALNSFSVADAIRYFSGVQLKDYGGVGGLKTINIRSMGTNQVGVFYNGIQLGNAQNGQVDLGKFSMDNIEEISLYNGQRSKIFQSARDFGSASSIYIQPRKPHFASNKNTNIKANLKFGSFDLINPSLLMEYKINNNISLSFNGEWINASGKYKVHYRRVLPKSKIVAYDTVAIRQNGDINAVRLEAALYGTLEKGTWNVNFYNYSSDRGVPGAVINNKWKRGERMQDINSFVQGNMKLAISDRWNTLLNIKYASDYTHFENFDYTLYPTNNKFRQKEFYIATANLFYLTDFWDVSFSYDFQYNTLDADFQRMDNYDIFAYPRRTSHWLSLATSLDLNRLKIQASLLGTLIHETVRKYNAPDDKHVMTPAVFASYRLLPNEDLRLNAFAKKIFRVATFNEMYYVEMISSNIKPEYATQYDLGLKYTKRPRYSIVKNIDAQIDVYYNLVEDKIICTPKSPLFKWTTYNLGLVKIKGLDVSVGNMFRMGNVFLQTKLQYTYQEARNYTDPGDTFYGHQIPYIPWHSGTVIASALYKDWTLNYSFIYTGERYSQSDNIVYNHVQPWYTHDVSLVKKFRIKDMNFKATLEVNNLFDQDYEVIFNYPMPKRNYRFSLVVEL